MTSRRAFLTAIAGAMASAAAFERDPERLLWRPGAKLISIPKHRFDSDAPWVIIQQSMSREEFARRYPPAFHKFAFAFTMDPWPDEIRLIAPNGTTRMVPIVRR